MAWSLATQSTLSRSFVARALVCRIPRLFREETHEMRNEFTSIIERDGEWYVAYSPEIPGANGQGRTEEKALGSLKEAIALILEDRREDGLRGVPDSAVRGTVAVE
jgi:predicted RNase H-like HicB family nuclease